MNEHEFRLAILRSFQEIEALKKRVQELEDAHRRNGWESK
jgi:hypothetical protein